MVRLSQIMLWLCLLSNDPTVSISILNVDSLHTVFGYLSLEQLVNLRFGNKVLNQLFIDIYGDVIHKLQHMEYIIATNLHLDQSSLSYISNTTIQLRLDPIYCDNWDKLIDVAYTRWENKSDPFGTHDFEQLLDAFNLHPSGIDDTDRGPLVVMSRGLLQYIAPIIITNSNERIAKWPTLDQIPWMDHVNDTSFVPFLLYVMNIYLIFMQQCN